MQHQALPLCRSDGTAAAACGTVTAAAGVATAHGDSQPARFETERALAGAALVGFGLAGARFAVDCYEHSLAATAAAAMVAGAGSG